MATQLFELFPIPLLVVDLMRPLSEAETNSIEEALKNTRANRGNQTSVNTFILNEKPLGALKQFCLDAIDKYSGDVFKQIEIKLDITQSWVNESVVGQFHHLHNHPNSMVSGVFYVIAEQDDIIQFHRHREPSSFLYEVSEYNPYNSVTWFVPVKTGQLLLFPSHLFHEVPTVKSQRRISLSFNTFAVDSFGSKEMLCSTRR